MSVASRAQSEGVVAEGAIARNFQTDELRASVLDKTGSKMVNPRRQKSEVASNSPINGKP
eukprot:4629343-Amphidinium_carterae.1